jgi:hypothetical protein
MTSDEMQQVIRNAGGEIWALEFADELLVKVNRLEESGRYAQLLTQLRSAREPGDFRGRVLEVNFADQFLRNREELVYGARQGMKGDIDFLWNVVGLNIFIETKLLGQHQPIEESIRAQLEAGGTFSIAVSDDTRDIRRMQYDLISKATTTKFNPKPSARWMNIVAVDVAELQLGTVDAGDCIVAAAGNAQLVSALGAVPAPIAYGCCRPDVVGVFERPTEAKLTPGQRTWISEVHGRRPAGMPHPRDYIHGALFLSREPRGKGALSYELSGILVWNSALVTIEMAGPVVDAIRKILPPGVTRR